MELPAELADGDGSLIYVSLGSLGSGDVPLMKELVAALAETPHRYVVSKGPQHTEYELAGNMVGDEFLPQVSVLPQVDLVITHGGNNTTTECLHFGKPMVVLPIFWDQHDNAQRIDETGFGIRFADLLASRRATCPRRSIGCSQTVSSAPASRMSRSGSRRVPALSGQPS